VKPIPRPIATTPIHSESEIAAAIAIVSMLLWSSIIFAGRWIAYFA